jgi:hypothetical protein
LFRVDGTTLIGPIDWDGDGSTTPGTFSQDVNFSGGTSSFNGFNDWANIDLRQVGISRMTGKLSLDIAKDDLNCPDPPGCEAGDEGLGDEGLGDEGLGDEGLGDEGLGDEGLGDEGLGDEGLGDEGLGDEGLGGELDLDTAKSLGNAPNSLTATIAGSGSNKGVQLNWTAPNVGSVTQYEVWRATGTTISPSNKPVKVCDAPGFPACPGTPPAALATNFKDLTVKNNTTYTYLVVAVFGGDGTKSGPSNFVTITFR